MPNLPSGWFEYVDDTSGKPYYYHQASNVTTWERPAAPNTSRAPQVKPKEATQSSESSGSLPGGLLSQIQVGAKLKKVAVKAPEASTGSTPPAGSNTNSLFAELAAAKLKKTSASPHPVSSFSSKNSSSPVAQNGAKGAGFADIMRKNRESAAAKASLAGLAPAASNAPLGCHQTSSTASISAYTSASNPASQNGNHNGSQNGGRIALNSSSQLQINGNDKASIGTNKPTNNLNSSNNSNNSSYGHSTHNNNTTTITSIPVKAVTPGIASRTRATPAVQTTRNNCSSSPTRYRVDEGTEEIEIEDRDRDRDRERHMGGSNGVRIQSNNNNQNSNHNDSQNETPNEHKNQNQNQNYNSNQSGRVRSEHRQVAGSPSMGDVSARLLSIEMKLDKILKHLGI